MELNNSLEFSLKYESLFSEYMPPSFSITPIGGFDIYSVLPKDSSDNIEPYSFTMSNFSTNNKRRLLYLPEITNYIKLINFMIDQRIINQLCDISQQDEHSFSQITQVQDGEVRFIKHEGDYDEVELVGESTLREDEGDDPSTYTNNIVDKLNRAKGAKGILCLDISNCYKSIYTHYLASIKLGLAEAKDQYKLSKSTPELVEKDYLNYTELDRLVRMLNSNESSGILAGPRVSNYLVEAYVNGKIN